MKKGFIIAAASLQFLVLVYMAGEREWVVRTGHTVFLRTMPIDPQDPFRGDYVRLDYEINHVATNRLQGRLADLKSVERGRRVYASLVEKPGGVAGLEGMSGEVPEKGIFIRGRTERFYDGDTLPVRYGIEAFFVKQTQGQVMENARRRGDVQVPLEMEVAMGGNGMAVLKGYRWCPLGIGLKMENTTNRFVRSITVQLMNVSSNNLAIVDVPGGASLTLEADRFRSWGERDWAWVGRKAPGPVLSDGHVVVLKPNEVHEIRVDLERPEWFVTKRGSEPKSLGGLGWNAMFRLVYRSPSAEECRRLKQGELIWQGELMSRAFGGGRVD
jgi:uncharacterized membrane-anchored protein